MGISLLPDLDGLSLLGGVEAYQTYHHLLTHNLTACLVAVAAIRWFTPCSLRASLLLVALFHLHLLMDLFGSGPGWGIAYFWPWSHRIFATSLAWSFGGWQNYLAFSILAVWTAALAVRCRRTPLEVVAPRFDAFLLRPLRRKD